MQAWAIIYRPALFDNALYETALKLLDTDSQQRIRRFYRRDDACRTLIGRLLVRMVLLRENVDLRLVSFNVTTEGKPYIILPGETRKVAFNVTHDNALVAIAFAPGLQSPPAFTLGIDVMKVQVPRGEPFLSFVESMEDQLTINERRSLENISEEEQLRRFFWMWTLKEAYTKALGLGLGFDFKRIELLMPQKRVLVNKIEPLGWRFDMFVIHDDDDRYQGVVAEYKGGEETELVEHDECPPWLTVQNTEHFVSDAVESLCTAYGHGKK